MNSQSAARVGYANDAGAVSWLAPEKLETHNDPHLGEALYYAAREHYPFIKHQLETKVNNGLGVWWGRVALGLPLFVVSYFLLNRFNLMGNGWVSGGVVLGLAIGFGLDVYSTILRHSQQGLYEKHGWDYPAPEDNPFLPEFPTPQQVVFNWSTVLHLLIIIASFFWPAIGVPVIAFRLFVSALNYRIYQRLKWVAEYIEK